MTSNVQQSLQAACAALSEEFAGVFGTETVARCVDDSYQRLLPAAITGYLPRFARERLGAAARSADTAGRGAPGGTPLVLFVCTANSGRS